MNTRRKHVQYYVSLAIILIAGFLMMALSGKDSQMRMLSVLMTAFFYVVWGIVHHILHHDTSVRVVVEYVLIGALGIALVLIVH
jgi:hypothetical protein